MSVRSHANARQISAAQLDAGDRVQHNGRMCDVTSSTEVSTDGQAVVNLRLWPHEVTTPGESRDITVRCFRGTAFRAYKAL